MSATQYFKNLGATTWQRVADLIEVSLAEIVYDDDDMLDRGNEPLWDCDGLTGWMECHQQYIKEGI